MNQDYNERSIVEVERRLLLQLASQREHFETLIAERDKARIVQASEYERRLSELNGAHERAERVRDDYETKEAALIAYKELSTKIDTNREYILARVPLLGDVSRAVSALDRIDVLEKANSEQRGRLAVVAAGLSVLIPIVTIFIARLINAA